MKYYVDVGGETVEVELGKDEVTVDGTPVRAELSTVDGTLVRLLAEGDSVHPLIVRRGEQAGRWLITVNGRTTEVDVQDERTRALAKVAGGPRVEGPRQVIAPMPGLVVRVNVAPGDQVTAGQGVVVIEAMKMENELRAAADGTVATVAVAPGAAVEKGSVLITFE